MENYTVHFQVSVGSSFMILRKEMPHVPLMNEFYSAGNNANYVCGQVIQVNINLTSGRISVVLKDVTPGGLPTAKIEKLYQRNGWVVKEIINR